MAIGHYPIPKSGPSGIIFESSLKVFKIKHATARKGLWFMIYESVTWNDATDSVYVSAFSFGF